MLRLSVSPPAAHYAAPYRTPALTSRRLCFCLDLRMEFFRQPPTPPHYQIWNRNCSLISLEAGCRVLGRRRRKGCAGANYLPPSLHYAACFPVSASQVLPPPTPPPPRPSTSTTTNTQRREHDTPAAHTHVYGEQREGSETWERKVDIAH